MNDKNRAHLLKHQTVLYQTLQKQLARPLALNVSSAHAAMIARVADHEKQMRSVSAIIARTVTDHEKLRRSVATIIARTVTDHEKLRRSVSAIVAGVVEREKLMCSVATTIARTAEAYQYWQKSTTLGFPNIIRSGLSIDSFPPLVPGQHYVPSPVSPTVTITDEVYEEIPPDTISTPWTESVLPKTNGKAADKRFFIGHGRSDCWKEFRDFIEKVLGLPHDEFNRVSTAGLAITERLRQMTDQVDMAFLIMTSENQYADGTWHARENVVHEVGLFQGVLGFKKAIILLEEGCEEFSNIHGLGQIRFPKGNIKAAFEDIRRVLKREGIIS